MCFSCLWCLLSVICGVLWWCVFYYGVFGGVVFCGFDPLVIRL